MKHIKVVTRQPAKAYHADFGAELANIAYSLVLTISDMIKLGGNGHHNDDDSDYYY